MIIILNGSGTSGKDTFVDYIKMFIDCPVYNLSTVDKVKEAAELLGWAGKKEEKDRQFLSDLKDAWVRYSDGSFRNIVSRVNNIKSKYQVTGMPYLIFIHAREPEEILRLKNLYSHMTLTVLVKRDNITEYSNHADKNVDNFNYDVTIINDSTLEAFKDKTLEFINQYIGSIYIETKEGKITEWLKKASNLVRQKIKVLEDKK